MVIRAKFLPFLSITFLFFFSSSVLAVNETTVYLGSVEKTLETGEQRIYYGAGSATAVRSIKGATQAVSFLHSDWLGSTVLVTDTGGNKVSAITYYPFGKETASLSLAVTGKTDKFYTGQRKDVSSDLYFYNARYYNPKTGRFVSADKAQGLNRYAYVLNNPIMMSDPTGNIGVPEWMRNLGNRVGEFVNRAFDDPAIHKAMFEYPEFLETSEENRQVTGVLLWMGIGGASLYLGPGVYGAYELADTAITCASGDMAGCHMALLPGPASVHNVLDAESSGPSYALSAALVEKKTGRRVYEQSGDLMGKFYGYTDYTGDIYILDSLSSMEKNAVLAHEYGGHRIFGEFNGFPTNQEKLIRDELFALSVQAKQTYASEFAVQPALKRIRMASEVLQKAEAEGLEVGEKYARVLESLGYDRRLFRSLRLFKDKGLPSLTSGEIRGTLKELGME